MTNSPYKFITVIIWSLLLLSGISWTAEAHPMPNTTVELSVTDQNIAGLARMPLLELESAIKSTVTDVKSDNIRLYFLQHILAHTAGNPWTTEILDISLDTEFDQNVGKYSEVLVSFRLTPPAASDLRHFTLDYDAIVHEVLTHKILIFLGYDWGTGELDQDMKPVGYIAMNFRTGELNPLTIDLDHGSWLQGTLAMFFFGMKHIREGLDHILFLIMLLLVAPLIVVNRSWQPDPQLSHTIRRFFMISLSFTLGHSLTLLIGSFEMLSIGSRYIEILIAVSILVSAAHSIRPVFYKNEIYLAGGFGLIHGLAFSGALAAMDLSWQARLLSVLGFNLGLEAMQLITMVAFIPVLLPSKWRIYAPLRIILAAITMIIAAAWVLERATGSSNAITDIANNLLQ